MLHSENINNIKYIVPFSNKSLLSLYAPFLLLYSLIIFFETKYYSIFTAISPFKQKVNATSIITFIFLLISIINLLFNKIKNEEIIRINDEKYSKLTRFYSLIIIIYFLYSLLMNFPIQRVLNFSILYSTPFIFYYSINKYINKQNYKYFLKIFLYSFIISSFLGLFTISDLQSLISRDKYTARWAGIFYSNMVGGYYFGIFSLIFISLYKIKNKKIFLIFFVISLLFTFFSQTRMYVFALLVSLSIILVKNKIKIIFPSIIFIIFLVLSYKTSLQNYIINIPVVGLTFDTLYSFFDFLSSGGDLNQLMTINFTGNNKYALLSTLSDRLYFQIALLDNANLIFGNGLASSTVYLQKNFFHELDIAHSDLVTFIYEFGIILTILYYIFFIRLLYNPKFPEKFKLIAISFLFFDIFSGLTSSNLHLSVPRIIMFWGFVLIKKHFELEKQF